MFAIVFTLLVAACGGTGSGSTTSSGGDEPIAPPGEVNEVPQPRPPIPGNSEDEVFVSEAELSVMESYPIQVSVRVSGDKPTPCHEVFWTVEDSGDELMIRMVAGAPPEVVCAQVLDPFMVTVPLGRWADASRTVVLNGEIVGDFEA